MKRLSDGQSFSACRISALATPFRLKDSSTQISQTNPAAEETAVKGRFHGLRAAQDHSPGILAVEAGDIEISGIGGAAQEACVSVIFQRATEIRVGVEIVRLRLRNLNLLLVHLGLRMYRWRRDGPLIQAP